MNLDQPQKTCVLCGDDCAGQPRIKDLKGRYYHRTCYENARRAREARAVPESVSLLAEILDEPAGAGPGAGEIPCPACRHALPSGAVLCTNCGHSLTGGHVVATTVRTPAKEWGEGVGQLAALFLHPLFGAAAALTTYVLFYIAMSASPENPGVAQAFTGWHMVFSSAVSVLVLIFAFREGIGKGFLTLCVPFYILYFVYGICEYYWVRYLYTVHLLAVAMGFFIMPASAGGILGGLQ